MGNIHQIKPKKTCTFENTNQNHTMKSISNVWLITIFSFSCVSVLSWIVQFAYNNDTMFSGVTNIAYIFLIIIIPIISYIYTMDISAFIYTLSYLTAMLGASSFAFHINPTLNTRAHTLDIAMGWVVHTYLASIALLTLLPHLYILMLYYLGTNYKLMKNTENITHRQKTNKIQFKKRVIKYMSHVIVSLIQTISVFLIFGWFDTIYRNQNKLYIICGVITYLCTYFNRFIYYNSNTPYSRVISFALASVDLITLLC